MKSLKINYKFITVIILFFSTFFFSEVSFAAYCSEVLAQCSSQNRETCTYGGQYPNCNGGISWTSSRCEKKSDSSGSYIQVCQSPYEGANNFICSAPYGFTYGVCETDPPPPPTPDPPPDSGSGSTGSNGYSSQTNAACAIDLDVCKAKIQSTTSIEGYGWTKDMTCAITVTPKGPSVCMNDSATPSRVKCTVCGGGESYPYNTITGQPVVEGSAGGSGGSGSTALTCTSEEWSKEYQGENPESTFRSLGLKGRCKAITGGYKCCLSNDPQAVEENNPFDPTGTGKCGQGQEFYKEMSSGGCPLGTCVVVEARCSPNCTHPDEMPISTRCRCEGRSKEVSSIERTAGLVTFTSLDGITSIVSKCDYTNIDPAKDNDPMGSGDPQLPKDKTKPCKSHETKVLKCDMTYVCQDAALPVDRCKCNGTKPTADGGVVPKCEVTDSKIPGVDCQDVGGGRIECTNPPKNTDPNKAKTGTDQCGVGQQKAVIGTYTTAPSPGAFTCNGVATGKTDWCKCVVDPNAPANATTSRDAGNFYCQGGKKYVYNKTAEKFIEAANGDTYGCDFGGGAVVGSGSNGSNGSNTNNNGDLQKESTAQTANALSSQGNTIAKEGNALAAQGNSIAEKGNITSHEDSLAIKGSIDKLGDKLGNGLSKGDVNGDGTVNGIKAFDGNLGTTETGYAGFIDNHLKTADQAPKTSEIESSLMGKFSGLSDIVPASGCINPTVSANGKVLTALSSALSTTTVCDKTEWIRELVDWLLRIWLVVEVISAFNRVFSSITNTPL